jgi:hypothetical protein
MKHWHPKPEQPNKENGQLTNSIVGREAWEMQKSSKVSWWYAEA